MKALAAVLLIGFFIILMILGIGTWSCNQPPKADSETQQTEQSQEKHCTTFYITLIAGLGATGNFVRTYDKEIVAISTVVIAIFTFILSIFTVNLSIATKWLYSIAVKSGNIANENAYADCHH